jgi:hypothetical protein
LRGFEKDCGAARAEFTAIDGTLACLEDARATR